MKRGEAMQILQIYKDEIEQRIDEADAPDVKDVYRWQMDGFCMAIEALQILGDDGIVNCCGCIHWKTDGGAMMMCELWDTPMGDFDYCSYGKRKGGDDE